MCFLWGYPHTIHQSVTNPPRVFMPSPVFPPEHLHCRGRGNRTLWIQCRCVFCTFSAVTYQNFWLKAIKWFWVAHIILTPARIHICHFFATGTISRSRIWHQKRINCDTTNFATNHRNINYPALATIEIQFKFRRRYRLCQKNDTATATGSSDKYQKKLPFQAHLFCLIT